MDKNLIEEVQENNEAAFTTIYHQYHTKLYYYFLNKTRSHTASADLVQSTFLKLWNYRAHLNHDIALSHQVFRIAKTTLIDLLRQKAREKLLSLDEYASAADIPETPAATNALADDVNATIAKIPPQRGRIVQLRLKGWSNQEIAAILGISRKTVENQLNKAIKEIRSLLSTDTAVWVVLYLMLCTN